jgi:RNA polymerase sigma-70 factor (ECF subfamily)
MKRALEHLSDEEAMSLVQNGDMDAFAELAHRHEQKLLNFLYRFVGNAAQAEDLVQATLLKVYRSRARFKGSGKFSTWLYTIAANVARDYLRKTKKYRFLSLDAPVGQSSNVIDFFEAEGQSACDSVQRKEMAKVVQLAIARLPREQRMVIVLSHYEDMAYNEIARIMKCSKGTVKSRVFRAKIKLKEFLADYLAGKEVASKDELQESDTTTASSFGP